MHSQDEVEGNVSGTANSRIWVSLSTAAAILDVSEDVILKQAVPWQLESMAHHVRSRLLALSIEGTGAPRFFAPDLETLLVNPESPTDARANCIANHLGCEMCSPEAQAHRTGNLSERNERDAL